ncbi:MAG TPA: hypothetical protein PL001_09155 [Candidatus Kryptobacter bacterium]|nr:hypothetical protein [Candidatus Kryptobacter bacterium]
MFTKFIAVLLIFMGETLSIGAELIAARRFVAHGSEYASIFLYMFTLITIGGALLVLGYMFGYVYLKNIWIIAAISVGSILIVEPLLTVLLFKQLPTMGAAIGLGCGVLGIFASLFL